MDGRRDEHPELPVDPDTAAHRRPGALALVFAGGVLGTLGRDALARWLPTSAGHWAWGTFAANLAGAFVLGVLLEFLARRGPDAGPLQRWRLFAGTGFCGALTTYSTLAIETDLLVRAHDAALGTLYLIVSIVLGFAAGAGGIALAGRSRAVDAP